MEEFLLTLVQEIKASDVQALLPMTCGHLRIEAAGFVHAYAAKIEGVVIGGKREGGNVPVDHQSRLITRHGTSPGGSRWRSEVPGHAARLRQSTDRHRVVAYNGQRRLPGGVDRCGPVVVGPTACAPSG